MLWDYALRLAKHISKRSSTAMKRFWNATAARLSKRSRRSCLSGSRPQETQYSWALQRPLDEQPSQQYCFVPGTLRFSSHSPANLSSPKPKLKVGDPFIWKEVFPLNGVQALVAGLTAVA